MLYSILAIVISALLIIFGIFLDVLGLYYALKNKQRNNIVQSKVGYMTMIAGEIIFKMSTFSICIFFGIFVLEAIKRIF